MKCNDLKNDSTCFVGSAKVHRLKWARMFREIMAFPSSVSKIFINVVVLIIRIV